MYGRFFLRVVEVNSTGRTVNFIVGALRPRQDTAVFSSVPLFTLVEEISRAVRFLLALVSPGATEHSSQSKQSNFRRFLNEFHCYHSRKFFRLLAKLAKDFRSGGAQRANGTVCARPANHGPRLFTGFGRVLMIEVSLVKMAGVGALGHWVPRNLFESFHRR